MDVFTAVVFDKRSVVPDHTKTFRTLQKAKEYVEKVLGHDEGPKWQEWDEGKFVFGYGEGDVEDVVAVVYGSEVED